MTDPENNFSRLNRKKGRKRSDKILNVLIVAVMLAIVITATIIFSGGNDEEDNKEPLTSEEVNKDLLDENPDADTGESDNEEEDASSDLEVEDPDVASDSEVEKEENEESGIVTYLYSDDEVIEQSIIDPSWEPIPTQQTGEHVSLYDGASVDWKEKEEAIAYATGLSRDDTITWKIKNGGSPQKSIGIVSSKDKAEKYRVHLEWIDNEGWKPVKLDVLKTLDFDY